VTGPRINAIHNYTSYLNIGTDQRGTAILIKNGITIRNVKRLPSGRGIAALFQGTWIINVYTPSGVQKRDAKERFYTADIISLLPVTRSTVILAGDFNCVLTQADETGRKNFSRALDTLVRGLALTDAWDHTTTRPIFTQ
jgi:exonuclease III